MRYERDEGDEGQPASVFVKLAPFDERQRRFVDAVGLGVAEARFYRDVAAGVPVRVPHVWHATVEGSRYVMVLKDLIAIQARFPRPDDADLEVFIGRLVDELARLHARFWAAPELVDGSLAFVGDGARLAFGGGGSFVGHAVERFAADLPPVFAELGARYVADAPAIAALWELEPRTLAHGDAHLGNLFVDRARPGFFDWAMVMPRAGMWDVAYVLWVGATRRPPGARDGMDRPVLRRVGSRRCGARRGRGVGAVPAVRRVRVGVGYVHRRGWDPVPACGHRAWRHGPGDRAVDDLDSLGALAARLNARS